MPRYHHWLDVPRSVRWPGRVIIVDADEVDSSEVSASGVHTPSLSELLWTQLRLERGQYTCTTLIPGRTADEWWTYLLRECSRGRSLTVLSQQTIRLVAMLGVWPRLESGDLILADDWLSADDPYRCAAEQIDADAVREQQPISASAIQRKLDWSRGYMVLSGPPVILRMRLRGSRAWITWVDSANYGVTYYPDSESLVSRVSRLTEWWRRYYRCCREYRLGSWHTTAGGQAYGGWRTAYYSGAAHTGGSAGSDTAAAAAYCGGRAECYFIGRVQAPLYYCDIRCCYPSVCRDHRLPARYRGTMEPTGIGPGRLAADYRDAAALCDVTTDRPYYPARRGGIVIYPIGRYRTWLCGPELVWALDRGHVTAVHEAHQWECEPLLADFARALYDLRCACESRHDVELKQCVKLMMNSLTGRLAQRDTWWVTVDDVDCELQWGEYHARKDDGTMGHYRVLGGIVQEQRDRGYVADALPWAAAWITSAARVKLLQAIECAGWEHVYYCDTDALMVDSYGYDRLGIAGMLSEGVMGGLERRWGPCTVEIRGVKYYVRDGEITCAGVPDCAKGDLIGDESYMHHQLPSEELRMREMPAGRAVVRSYRRDLHYRHGVVHPDGRVTPHVLGDQ